MFFRKTQYYKSISNQNMTIQKNIHENKLLSVHPIFNDSLKGIFFFSRERERADLKLP